MAKTKELQVRAEYTLTAQQLQAASMLAEGATYDQAGKAIGVHGQTVRTWMERTDGMKSEVERRAKESADRLQLLAQHARLDIMDLATNVGETLQEALAALNARGDPDWQTRLKAVEIVTKHGLPATPDGQQGRANAQAAVIVIQGDQLSSATKHIVEGDIIDAEVVMD